MDCAEGKVEVVGKRDRWVEGGVMKPVAQTMKDAFVITVKVEDGEGVVVGTDV